MKLKETILLISIYSTTLFAHELPSEFRFSSGDENPIALTMIISDTHDDGTEIRCALYGEDRNILAVRQLYTQELATTFLFYKGNPAKFTAKDVKDYKCVKVD